MKRSLLPPLVLLLLALAVGEARALSLVTLTVEELYSESEVVVEAKIIGAVSQRIDGATCSPLEQLKIVRSYKGNLPVGSVIPAWGYFREAPSGHVIAFIRKGSPDYAPTHPLRTPESLSTEPRMVAWKKCSSAIPYSVIFYGIAVLAVKNTPDLSGKMGVLFPAMFIAPPAALPQFISSDPPRNSATHYLWVSHKSMSHFMRSLGRKSHGA